MRYGVILPGGNAQQQCELAVLAERSGWDGVFVWEAAYGVDAWSLLAAIAVSTTRLRIGTLLTPLPWRRPWKLASQVATVDQLSNGRVVLTVGLGALESDLPRTGEILDLRGRAERLDEGIDLIRALWGGEGTYRGKHFTYEPGTPTNSRRWPHPFRSGSPFGSSEFGRDPNPCSECFVATGWSRSTNSRTASPPRTMPERSGTGWPSAARQPSTSWPRVRLPRTIRPPLTMPCIRGQTPAAPGGWKRGGKCPITAQNASSRPAIG